MILILIVFDYYFLILLSTVGWTFLSLISPSREGCRFQVNRYVTCIFKKNLFTFHPSPISRTCQWHFCVKNIFFLNKKKYINVCLPALLHPSPIARTCQWHFCWYIRWVMSCFWKQILRKGVNVLRSCVSMEANPTNES